MDRSIIQSALSIMHGREAPSNTAMIFKLSQLRHFLEHMKQQAPVLPLRDWGGENAIILRHDIDYDIGMAHRVACVEKEADVRSTHYILTTCPTYNPLERANRSLLREMHDWGFEIGLHFDPTMYDEETMRSAVDREVEILSFAVGSEVKSISLHCPSIHGRYPLFDGYRNAYDPSIFNDECYLSDSCMQFRGKDPYEFVKRATQRPIQVLLHPMHYSPTGGGYDAVVSEGIQQYIQRIHESFQPNPTYVKDVGDDLVAHLGRPSSETAKP